MKTVIIGFLAILILISGIYFVAYRSTKETTTITVNEKWIKMSQNDSGRYLISDKEGNVYSICDDYAFWTFNASDRYAKITAGNTYKITTVGWRVRFFSWYKNIITVN